MQIGILVNSFVKEFLNKCFGLFGAKLVTRSDFSINGLKPFMIEYFLRQSRGVLHVGAHTGQEAEFYNSRSLRVIWIEANPKIFSKLKSNIAKFSNQIAFNFLLASRTEIGRDFHYTNNDAHSASMFPLSQDHSWSGLVNTELVKLNSVRLDSEFDVSSLNGFDFWVIDTQGAELEVLEGAGILLRQCCTYLLVEISQIVFYDGGATYEDVRDFLAKNGFYPVITPKHPHEEVLFINALKF